MACVKLLQRSGSSVHGMARACTAPSMHFSTTPCAKAKKNYEVVIVGGGAGGCAMASKIGRRLGKGKVAVVEPHETHYYQPYWTLVGAGLKKIENSCKPSSEVISNKADWLKDKVQEFQPENNLILTKNGDEIKYEYLIVAVGLTLHYDWVKGLQEALKHDPSVCSNYSSLYVEKTFPAIQNFSEGNAIFTFPSTPVKCAGAPQKIMYLAEDYWRKNGKREKVNIKFNTSLDKMFTVKKYADALTEIASSRGIARNFLHNLIEVRHEKKEAVFEILNSGEKKETVTFPYSMLHVCPPMMTPDVLRNSSLVDATGFCDINMYTGQHTKYPNVFAIGDCGNWPTSKTAAAVAGQCGVLDKTIKSVMQGKEPKQLYDGYTSCPLITQYGKLILAEFGYNAEVLETFPIIDQGKESRIMYIMKTDMMPMIYWQGLLKGLWNGPGVWRKLMHLGMSK